MTSGIIIGVSATTTSYSCGCSNSIHRISGTTFATSFTFKYKGINALVNHGGFLAFSDGSRTY